MGHDSISLFPYIHGLLLASAPWLIGATTAVAATRRAAPTLPSDALSAGIGGYAGYLLCITIMRFLDPEIRLWWLGLVLALTYLAAGLVGYSLMRRGRRFICAHRAIGIGGFRREIYLFVTCFSILLALVVFAILYHTTNVPTQGWDVLDFWANVSRDFVLYYLQLPGADFLYAHRHPPTAALVAAWTPMTASSMELPSYPYLAWFFLWLSLGLVIYGFARLSDHNRSFSLVISCASMTIPLLEMHVYAPGYAELFILLSVVSSCAVIALSLDRSSRALMCAGLTLGASVMLTKNIAPFYFAVLMVPLLLVCVDKYSRSVRGIIGVCIFAFGVLVWWAWRNHLSMSVFGNLVGFDWRKGFFFGGWFLTIVQTSFEDITLVLSHAWFFNLSFGISISIFLVLSYYSFLIEPPSKRRASSFLLLCFFVGLCGTVASLFTDYAFRYAMPGSDTGNSRFSMPLVPILFLAISSVVRLKEAEVRRVAHDNKVL